MNNLDSNVFVKNLNKTITQQEFDVHFSQYGQILTSSMRYDKNGDSLGYGYVMYETKLEQQQAIKDANNTTFRERVIQVTEFKRKSQRQGSSSDNKCNVYFKQFPSNSDSLEDLAQLQATMQGMFSQFGTVTSCVVKMDDKLKKPFGFVAFDNHQSGQAAIDKLHSADPFDCGEPMYVSWAQSKYERKQQLNESAAQNNETKIYVRDLKLEITKEQLKEVFDQFGDIKTLSVKIIKMNEEDKKFGMIDFMLKEEATKAITQGPDLLEVKAITTNPEQPAYIKIAQSKEERRKYRNMLKHQQNNRQMQNMIGGMQMGSRRMMPLQMMPNPMLGGFFQKMMQQWMQQM